VTCCFYVALSIGIVVVAIQYIRKKETFHWKNIIGGIILGVPNYFSIWCIVKALQYNAIDSSVLYPINNMGIVILSSVAALLVFREKMSRLNWIGVAISVIAIGLMALDKFNC
jgi:multidrug transporter EmrE-like cation transporter